MKIKALIPIIIIGFVVAFNCHFITMASIDAPHNEASNDVGCGDCHGQGLLYSPFWGYDYTPAHIDDTPYNKICFSCHQYSSGDYTGNVAPLVQPHSDRSIKGPGNEAWARECHVCHDPHYQKQKIYKNIDADNLYLARGEITNCVDNGDDTSTLTYSTIMYKTVTGWDAAKLIEKTIENRRAILFPNIRKLGYSHEIKEVNDPPTSTIIVFGDACDYLPLPSSNFAVLYGQYIKEAIDVSPDISGTYTTVKFFDKIGQNSFGFDESVTGTDPTPYGLCQVCHTIEANPTNPTHWRADGSGADHYNDNTYERGCIHCHSHVSGFGHGSGGTGCIECHGHDAGYEYETGKFSQGKGTYISHSTHTELGADDSNGPELDCPVCHDTGNYPNFEDGKDFLETTVCDSCHSIGGSYDGVGVPYDDDNPNFAVEYPDSVAYGAKYHWKYKEGETWVQGIYSEIPVKYWQAFTHYELGDFVRYQLNVVRANKTFDSGATPNASNWDLVNPWQPNMTYQVDDYVRHGGNVYRCPVGFDSGDSFDENNWELICRWLEPLKTGKEKWCIGCHDAVPASSIQNGTGVLAPKVGGNNSTYGFYVSGHGRTGIEKECLDCHDAIFKHIDNNSRTYEVGGSIPGQTYRYGYRLNEDMAIPRNFESVDIAFKLCMGVCHDAHAGIFSDDPDTQYPGDPSDCNTHFRTQGWHYHEEHVIPAVGAALWDSDWNGQVGQPVWTTFLDSAISCPACHNVHGSPSPAMTRHGELISTPGTTDKVPAFDFRWYEGDKATQTDVLKDSYWGYVNMGSSPSAAKDNYVCDICHSTGDSNDGDPLPGEYYGRFPGCPEIAEMDIWTTDLSDNPKNIFAPGDYIRFHIRVVLTGLEGAEYFLQTVSSGASVPLDEGTWQVPLSINAYRPIGELTGYWAREGEEDYQIPSNAEPSSTATYLIDLYMLNKAGGYPSDRQTETHNFYIEPWPP